VKVAAVQSAPVNVLVERMLRDSDNQLAEALGRLAALRNGLPGSFSGATRAMVAAAHMHNLDVNVAGIDDASGLSREDLLSSTTLTGILQAAVSDESLRTILTGLPVAGFDGTLADRYLTKPESAAAGVVRAKTGTLTGVSAQAGTAITCDGELVLFAFMADRVPGNPIEARGALDRAAATLSRCP
jgi:D-alanyl-D-alanine carboxypeptidase/D-alanyl-D-alanine-endopeptidase (penicillin-binding protein 4)